MFLTRYRDTDNYLLRFIDELSLKNLCIAIPHLWIYKDEIFWQNRMKQNFPEYQKTTNQSWKQSYLTLLYYEIVKNKKYSSPNSKMSLAAKLGNKDVINYYISRGANKFISGMNYAAEGGHLDLVIFFENKIENKSRDIWRDGLRFAVRGNSDEIIIYFIEKGAELRYGFQEAFDTENIRLLKQFIYTRELRIGFYARLHNSICKGSLKLVRFFSENCSLEEIQQALLDVEGMKKRKSIENYLKRKVEEMSV